MMTATDILTKLIQKKREVFELEQQFYLALLNERTQSSLPQEQALFIDQEQRSVVGLLCSCREPVKVLQNYKGEGQDYYCCARPKATGCRFWVRADEVAEAGR